MTVLEAFSGFFINTRIVSKTIETTIHVQYIDFLTPWVFPQFGIVERYGEWFQIGSGRIDGNRFLLLIQYNAVSSIGRNCPILFIHFANEYKDNYGKTNAGWVNFSTLRYANNGWFVGSTADAVRNSYNGYTTVTAGKIEGAVTGQGNNRYAYFLIPEGCNYVVVDLENNTVLFDIK